MGSILSTNAVTGLNVVKFFGEAGTVAAGDGSESFPSSLYARSTAEETEIVPGTRAPSWSAGDFSDMETGVLAGAWNRLAPIRVGTMAWRTSTARGRNVKGLKLNGERAVASAGRSRHAEQRNGRRKWGFAELPVNYEPRSISTRSPFTARTSGPWADQVPSCFTRPIMGSLWEI